MKLKLSISVTFALFLTINAFGQNQFLVNNSTSSSNQQPTDEGTCGFLPTPEQIQKVENDPDFQEERVRFLANAHKRMLTPVVYVPIKAHIVRTTAGTGGITVADLNAAIANMNAYYINANMQFYICNGINYVDDDTYYDFDASEETALHTAEGVNNLINIYFCNTVTSGASTLCGYAYFPGGPDVIMMDNACAVNGSTLPHEMGHFFSLYHTHGTANGTLTDELVNGSNCSTNGDRVCDTPADPQLGNANVSAACAFNNTAPYTGGVNTDANGDTFAPNPNNIMSYSRKVCRNFFSPGQYARIYAAYTTQRNYFTCPTFNVDFSATPTTSCSTPLLVNFTDNSTGATSWQWDVDGDGTTDYTTQNPSHNYTTTGSYDVRLTVSNGTQTIASTKTNFINVGANYSVPFSENFESFTTMNDATGLANGWTTTPAGDANVYRWNPDDGGTVSNGTGPTVDNTLGTAAGRYMYTEASQGNAADVAELITPCIDLNSANPELTFAYHMHGGFMGELHLDIYSGGAWANDIMTALVGQQTANQTDAYSTQAVDLTAYSGQVVQLRFRAVRAGSWAGDMAIDDISISNSITLDVDFLGLTGHKTAIRNNELNWATTRELNHAYFDVERSMDGITFEKIGRIDGKGNTHTGHEYQFNDTDLETMRTCYYRLRIVDREGVSEYSDVISIDGEWSISNMKLYPNPSEGRFNLLFESDRDAEMTIEVYNGMGVVVASESRLAAKGNNLTKMDLQELSSGIYLVRVHVNGEQYNKTLVKK